MDENNPHGFLAAMFGKAPKAHPLLATMGRLDFNLSVFKAAHAQLKAPENQMNRHLDNLVDAYKEFMDAAITEKALGWQSRDGEDEADG